MKVSKQAIMKKVMKNIFFKLMFNILKSEMNFAMIYLSACKNDN